MGVVSNDLHSVWEVVRLGGQVAAGVARASPAVVQVNLRVAILWEPKRNEGINASLDARLVAVGENGRGRARAQTAV